MVEGRGAQLTRGDLARFLIGLVMAAACLLAWQVTETSGFWTLWGRNAFGLSVIPFLAGIGLLAWNGRSIFGWLLLVGGSAIIVAGILTHQEIYSDRMAIFSKQLLMVFLLGSIGWIGRAVRSLRK
ncbi:MAG TPA: hypothetical protein VGS22_25900 [Thermoanaerobaculia bacterium]|jgi:hypothetical protein|nr:hypothetical protein [Thermoanaerobaculia bacterium]